MWRWTEKWGCDGGGGGHRWDKNKGVIKAQSGRRARRHPWRHKVSSVHAAKWEISQVIVIAPRASPCIKRVIHLGGAAAQVFVIIPALQEERPKQTNRLRRIPSLSSTFPRRHPPPPFPSLFFTLIFPFFLSKCDGLTKESAPRCFFCKRGAYKSYKVVPPWG